MESALCVVYRNTVKKVVNNTNHAIQIDQVLSYATWWFGGKRQTLSQHLSVMSDRLPRKLVLSKSIVFLILNWLLIRIKLSELKGRRRAIHHNRLSECWKEMPLWKLQKCFWNVGNVGSDAVTTENQEGIICWGWYNKGYNGGINVTTVAEAQGWS